MRFKPIAGTLIVILSGTIASGQSNNRMPSASAERGVDHQPERVRMSDAAEPNTGRLDRNAIEFILAGIDDQTREEFQKAWWIAGAGGKTVEAVVLLYRGRNGSLFARSQGYTNQRLSFTFKWNPTIIGVVHTHPNACSPEPEGNDLQIADKFQVPVFTITTRGMFVYDPATRRTTKVVADLAWLEPSRRSDNRSLAASRRDPNLSMERRDK